MTADVVTYLVAHIPGVAEVCINLFANLVLLIDGFGMIHAGLNYRFDLQQHMNVLILAGDVVDNLPWT
jgi:hypothetical protein